MHRPLKVTRKKKNKFDAEKAAHASSLFFGVAIITVFGYDKKMKEKTKQFRFMSYFSGSIKLSIIGFGAMFITILLELLKPLIIREIIDKAFPQKNLTLMIELAVAFSVIVFGGGIISYFRDMSMARLGLNIVTKIKEDVFAKLLRLPISYLDTHTPGSLMARVESDTEKVKQLFSNVAINIFGNIILFAGMIAVIFTINLWFAIIFLLITPVFSVLVFFFFNLLTKQWDKLREKYSEIMGIITEYIQGINVIQAFNRIPYAEKQIKTKSEEYRNLSIKVWSIEFASMETISLLMGPVFTALVIKTLAPNIFSGAMTVGSLLLLLDYGKRVLDPIMALADNFKMIQMSNVALKRLGSILDEKDEAEGSETAKHFSHSIEFKNVSFAYKNEDWVLKNVSFSIKKGKTVALVGSSGSGKTTTVSLLTKLFNPQKGEILIDEKNINDFTLDSWRRKIGLVLQDVYLFPGSILENVRIYNDTISEEEVLKALESVHAMDFINKLPNGINTDLLERGGNLSQGERQLISFARACVINPEIIILDEATASVDPKTESFIKESTDKLLTNKTGLIVAHRLSSIINADEILMFHEGEIIARGTHTELMQSSSEYANLVKLQILKVTEKV